MALARLAFVAQICDAPAERTPSATMPTPPHDDLPRAQHNLRAHLTPLDPAPGDLLRCEVHAEGRPLGQAWIARGEDAHDGPWFRPSKASQRPLDSHLVGEILRSMIERALDEEQAWQASVRFALDLSRTPDGARPSTMDRRTLHRLGMTPRTTLTGQVRWVLDSADAAIVRAPTSRTLGLALSGGGLRAMCFSLGALRALFHLRLLEHTAVTCSASGSSLLAGAWLGVLDGKPLHTMRHAEVTALQDRVLDFTAATTQARIAGSPANRAPEGTTPGDPRQRTLCQLAEHINKTLCYRAGAPGTGPLKLGEVMEASKDAAHIFQITELERGGSLPLGEREGRGAHGPLNPTPIDDAPMHLPDAAVAPIRVADAVMASAAFPVGQAPFWLPDDFALDSSDKARLRCAIASFRSGASVHDVSGTACPTTRHDGTGADGTRIARVPLTDGGVYDNQGLGPVLRAARRPARDAVATGAPGDHPAMSYIAIIDADNRDPKVPLLTKALHLQQSLRASERRSLGRLVSVGGTAALLATAVLLTTLAAGLVVVLGPLLLALCALVLWLALPTVAAYAFNQRLPPVVRLPRWLTAARVLQAASERVLLGVVLMTKVFLGRIRALNYRRLHDVGLDRDVAVTHAHIRDLLRAEHRSDPRREVLSRRYAISDAHAELVQRAVATDTTLRLNLPPAQISARVWALIHVGEATMLRGLLYTLLAVPRPRHPDARALLVRTDQRWGALERASWGAASPIENSPHLLSPADDAAAHGATPTP